MDGTKHPVRVAATGDIEHLKGNYFLMITFWQVIALMGMMAVFMLSGVALGAYLVFHTKREPHERLFGGVPKGDVFSIDDLVGDEEEEEPAATSPPETIQKRAEEFVNQFADRLGG